MSLEVILERVKTWQKNELYHFGIRGQKKVRNKTHNSEVFNDFSKQSVELARKGYGGFYITEDEKRKYEETCAKYEKLYKETVAKYTDEYVAAFESDSGIKLTEKGKENVRKHYSNIPDYLWI